MMFSSGWVTCGVFKSSSQKKDVNNKDPKWRQELADIVAAAAALKDRVHHVVEDAQHEAVKPDSKLAHGSIGIGLTNDKA